MIPSIKNITPPITNLLDVDARLQTVVLGDQTTERHQLLSRLGAPSQHHYVG